MYNMQMSIMCTHIPNAHSHILYAHEVKHIAVLLTNSCKCNLRGNV